MYPHQLYQQSQEIDAGFTAQQPFSGSATPTTWQQPEQWQYQPSYPQDALCNPVFAGNLCQPPSSHLNMYQAQQHGLLGQKHTVQLPQDQANTNSNNGNNDNNDNTTNNNDNTMSWRDVTKTTSFKVWLGTYLLGIAPAAILSWRCNSNHGFSAPVKVGSALVAGLMSYNYLIAYAVYKGGTCDPKKSLARVAKQKDASVMVAKATPPPPASNLTAAPSMP